MGIRVVSLLKCQVNPRNDSESLVRRTDHKMLHVQQDSVGCQHARRHEPKSAVLTEFGAFGTAYVCDHQQSGVEMHTKLA